MNSTGWNYGDTQPLYNMIPFLRFSKLTDNYKDIANSLEDHLDWWMKDSEFMEKYQPAVNYIINTLKMNVTEQDILRVISSSYTNDFSHTLHNGNQVLKTRV